MRLTLPHSARRGGWRSQRGACGYRAPGCRSEPSVARGPGVWLLALLLLLAAPGAHARPRVLVVLGDSLSAAHGIDVEQGWVALLGARLARREPPWRVINASVSGATTSDGRARIGGLLARDRPAVVIVELGGNDGLRGIPMDTMRANLEAIVRRVLAAGARVLLLGVRLPPNYGAAYNRSFAAVFAAVARSERVALVPFLLEGVGGVPALMQADGLHPRAVAQRRLLENVWPALEPLLGPGGH